MSKLNGYRSLLLVGAGLLGGMSVSLHAAEELTDPVIGHAPVAAPAITPANPGPNTAVTASSGFSDADGDTEQGTTYEWFLNGAAVGTGQNYQLNQAPGGATLKLTATPRTDPAITNPAAGAAASVQVAIVQAQAPSLGDFVVRSPGGGGSARSSISDARALCAANGERLPTENELKAVRATVNNAGVRSNAFCTVHGWPSLSPTGCSPATASINYWMGSGFAGGDAYLDMNAFESGVTAATPTAVAFVVCVP